MKLLRFVLVLMVIAGSFAWITNIKVNAQDPAYINVNAIVNEDDDGDG